MNSTRRAHKLQKKNSRGEQGVWKNGAPDRSTANPHRHRCLTLITRKSITVQVPRYEHAGPGESELPNEWWGESQAAYRDKYTCIYKSEL